MTTKRFTAEVYAGHTTDRGALVPFDPAKTWQSSKPITIEVLMHALG